MWKTVYSPLPWSKTEGEGDWVRETVQLACDWHCLVMSHCDICRDFERNIRNDNKVANLLTFAHLCYTIKPVNTRDTIYGYAVCHGVPKSNTIPVPAVPVLEAPWVNPYPCGTLVTGTV